MSFLPHDTWLEMNILLVPNKISISIYLFLNKNIIIITSDPNMSFNFYFSSIGQSFIFFAMRYVHIFCKFLYMYSIFNRFLFPKIYYFLKNRSRWFEWVFMFRTFMCFYPFHRRSVFGVYWTCIEFLKSKYNFSCSSYERSLVDFGFVT